MCCCINKAYSFNIGKHICHLSFYHNGIIIQYLQIHFEFYIHVTTCTTVNEITEAFTDTNNT